MSRPGTPPQMHVTVVEAPGCHFCRDALEALAVLVAEGHPLEVECVDARSADGVALMRHHRVGLSPLVLVDGRFFSQGRLPRRKLSRLLQQRSADVGYPPRPEGLGWGRC